MPTYSLGAEGLQEPFRKSSFVLPGWEEGKLVLNSLTKKKYLIPREGAVPPGLALSPPHTAQGYFCAEVTSVSISLIH